MKDINTTDKFLILIFFVCMLQSILSIFIKLPFTNPLYSAVDIVNRTTASAIFGFFISGNFDSDKNKSNDGSLNVENFKDNSSFIAIPHEIDASLKQQISSVQARPTSQNENLNLQENSTALKSENAKIYVTNGENVQDDTTRTLLQGDTEKSVSHGDKADLKMKNYKQPAKLQTIIAGTICLSLTIVLLIARNLGDISLDSTSTISQIRDLIGGSLGYILGSNNKK